MLEDHLLRVCAAMRPKSSAVVTSDDSIGCRELRPVDHGLGLDLPGGQRLALRRRLAR
jgi:hypothetical protein